MSSKLIIFSAPSGSGKSTIIRHLLKKIPNLEFSISCTSRSPRSNEQDTVDYYFISPDIFREKIENQEFIEYEEVYTNLYYGTLVSEIERISTKGNTIIFDVDVVGGINIKKRFGENALALFISPPSIAELRNRLTHRGTDSPEMIDLRINKAQFEISFADKFDKIIVNDDLQETVNQAETAILDFLKS
ncbi:MAG: guanylate kinase [Paludibacter sp.]|nr:guanylate kinase [Paludibacter sp.]